MSDIEDGGPAFPYPELHDSVPMPNGEYRHLPASTGMSKRELSAAILMHAELVTSSATGRDMEQMAQVSIEAADALLRALGAPAPTQHRELYASEKVKVDAADRLAGIVEELQREPVWPMLPEPLRIAARDAACDVLDPEIPF